MAHLKIGEILIKQGLINDAQLKEAIKAQSREQGRIGEVLIKLGILSENAIAAALATQLNIPFLNNENNTLNPEDGQILKETVPYNFAKSNLVLPLKKAGNTLTCAVADPFDLLLLDNLKMLSGCDIQLAIATRADLISAIQEFYVSDSNKPKRSKSVTSFGQEESISSRTSDDDLKEDPQVAQLKEKATEAPVIKTVDLIIRQAIEQRASDIHLEPYKKKIGLRYRIDGVLYEIPPPDHQLALPIVSRIKILAKLDIAEKRLPQDGAISFDLDERIVDIRVSTIPTIWGEKVVMRILDKTAVPLELTQLGFQDKDLDRIRACLKKPFGLFFVTGPTGSGKSSTLYASLNEIFDPRKNILTVEDPVEYKLTGINQVNVRPDIGLTFASALRSFLRQDPDVIMVGEVRDLETAQICVRAALTGHFVLSTLHTNDAASAITRLIDIGIEPYLLTPSLTMIIAQRLSRRLCPKCKQAIEPVAELFGGINFKSDLIYKGKGCEDCHQTGYHGRIVITEVMEINEEIRELITVKTSYTKISEAARANGMRTLFEDGIKKVEEGITSFEEVLSITRM